MLFFFITVFIKMAVWGYTVYHTTFRRNYHIELVGSNFPTMWVKQCHLHHPPVITIFIGGVFFPFSVMGGKHGIVLPTNPMKPRFSRSFPFASWQDDHDPSHRDGRDGDFCGVIGRDNDKNQIISDTIHLDFAGLTWYSYFLISTI